jgi:hypothetical protein
MITIRQITFELGDKMVRMLTTNYGFLTDKYIDPDDGDQDDGDSVETPKSEKSGKSKDANGALSIIKLDKSKASFVEAVVLCLPKVDKL